MPTQGLHDVLLSSSEKDANGGDANVVDGLFAIARSLDRVARALRDLGTGDAATPMGAIEMLSKEVHDGLGNIAVALERHDA